MADECHIQNNLVRENQKLTAKVERLRQERTDAYRQRDKATEERGSQQRVAIAAMTRAETAEAERDAALGRETALREGIQEALAPYGSGPTDLAIVDRLRALAANAEPEPGGIEHTECIEFVVCPECGDEFVLGEPGSGER